MSALTTRLALAAAAIAILPAVLAGCSLIPHVGGGGGGGVTAGPTVPDAGDGDADTPFDSLPATFPSDIPLLEGEVVQGIDVGTGWSVLIACDDPVADFNTAADALEAAGYETNARSADNGEGFGNFTNDSYSINLSASDTADFGTVVAYTVVKLG